MPEMRFEAPKKFQTPEEEIAFLRGELQKKTQEAQVVTPEKSKEAVAHELVQAYKTTVPHEVLHPKAHMGQVEQEGVALRLSPESHDDQIAELYALMMEKGVKNAMGVVEKMKNAHLEDDFHRFLVQYLQSKHNLPGLEPKQELYKAIDMHLFEVTLPAPTNGEPKPYKEFVTLMEQFYAGMLSVSGDRSNSEKNYYTVELALSNQSDEVVFYVSVPSSKVDMFEKQVFGLYDNAKIDEVFNDYNVFHEGGASAGAYAMPRYSDVLSLKTHDTFEHDPLGVLLNVFSKMKREGEGAAIQFVIMPAGDRLVKEYGMILDHVKKGATLNDAIKAVRSWGHLFFKVSKEIIGGERVKEWEKEKKEEQKARTVNEDAISSITKKLESTIVETNIRIISSAETKERSEALLHDLVSAFNQFTDSKGNGLDFRQVKGNDLSKFLHQFAFRLLSSGQTYPVSLRELATLYHFPMDTDTAPQLKQAQAGTSPAPLELIGHQGVLLGKNSFRGRETEIRMGREDRVRHLYMLGQTGTGKTTLFKNMIAQDIANGDGCCYIDPHGTDIQDILSYIPKERIDDVIYFDPAYMPRPMGLNMLEFDPNYPEQKTFVVNELMGIFNKLFDMKTSGGPMFEQYFRNSAGLVMEHPESGNTLLDISRVLSDKKFRDMKLAYCKNPLIKQFWKNAEATSGEQGLENFVPYITSKFDVFLSNEIMRPIVTQEKSAFNFRKIMDEKKILLVNLSKGRLGELNANLIGMIIVGKIQMAALSRVDMYGKEMNDFYLYIDEFQNVTTDSIESILSEARKYRLSLNIAHQFIAQLEENIRDAVFGNVGSMSIFRGGVDDAQFLENTFKPTFTAQDIMKLPNWNAYMKLLVKGLPTKPFNMVTLAPPAGNKDIVGKVKELSYLKHGRPREEVEAEVMKKFESVFGPTPDIPLRQA